MKTNLFFIILVFFGISLFANTTNSNECKKKGENYIKAKNECIEFFVSEGDREKTLNIIVHGTWNEGTNTLARYSPFAENISMATDITTIAVALPGYSGSSTNEFKALSHNDKKDLASDDEYIKFLAQLIQNLKSKFKADSVNYIGHSAGAKMGSILSAYKPELLDNMIFAGGFYDINKISKNKKSKILLIYGGKDLISKAKHSKDFYKQAKKENMNINILGIQDAVHLDLDMRDESIEAISEMLEE